VEIKEVMMEINGIRAVYLCKCGLFYPEYTKHLDDCRYMIIPQDMVGEGDTPRDVLDKVERYMRFKKRGDIVC
jgi:hypothetical protein